jgi:signal transduction histidine kinase/CheY-like chemotaxis protein
MPPASPQDQAGRVQRGIDVDFIQDELSAGYPSPEGRKAPACARRAGGVPRPGTPEQLEALRQLAEMLTGSLDLDEVLLQVRRAVIEVLGFDRCGVWLVDEEQRTVQGRWGTDRQGNLVDERHLQFDIRDAMNCFGWVAQNGQPFMFFSDFELHAQQTGKRCPPPVMEGVKENAALAMRSGDRVVGVITVDNLLTGRPFGQEDLDAMWPFVDLAGAAVANARLYDRARRQEALLREILEISRELSAELSLGRLLEALAEHATALAGVPRADLLLKTDEETLELLVGVRKDRGLAYNHVDQPGAVRIPMGGSPLMARALREGRSFTTEGPDDPQYNEAEREWARAHGYQATAIIPMLHGGRPIGLLTLIETRHPRRITASEVELFQMLAGQAAIAIENARLYEAAEASYRELQATHERLVQSERLRALGEMGGAVAHHFNNTLATVIGNAELALRPGVLASEVRRRLETIARAACSSADVVKRVQQFARQGNSMPRVPVDLAAVAEEALATAQPLREAAQAGCHRPIVLRRLLQPVPPLLADPMELRQALIYLIENAVEAMPAGGTLTLQTAVEAPHVVLRVRDTGAGIPAAIRPRIFEPFFTTRPAPRSGLGLSVTYGILNRHRGTVEVESEEGMGSTFTLRFPVAQPPAEVVPPPAARPASRPPIAAKVLVVEDDPLVREVVESVLAADGYVVTSVSSAEAALDSLSDPALSLVITDHGLPGMSGADLARTVKAVRPSLPIVMLTGWSADLEQGAAHGVIDLLLSKPIAIRSLQEAIRQRLGRPPEA